MTDHFLDETPEGLAALVAMRCHHPDATPAEESIAWRLWQSAWSERGRASSSNRSPMRVPLACTGVGSQGLPNDDIGYFSDAAMDHPHDPGHWMYTPPGQHMSARLPASCCFDPATEPTR